MSQVIHGKVHGTTIELYQPLGIPDGQEVELTLRTVATVVKSRHSGEGFAAPPARCLTTPQETTKFLPKSNGCSVRPIERGG